MSLLSPAVAIAHAEYDVYFARKAHLIKDYDLGSCCPKGAVACDRCATNLMFRGGSPATSAKTTAELVARVASGQKPVGTIVLGRDNNGEGTPSPAYPPGVVEVARHKNRWGIWVSVITAMPDATFGSLLDYETVRSLVRTIDAGPDDTIRMLASRLEFVNEDCDMVTTGVLYGYPIWSSIVLSRGLRGSPIPKPASPPTEPLGSLCGLWPQTDLPPDM